MSSKPVVQRLTGQKQVAEAELARRIRRFPYFSRVEGPSGPRTVIEGRSMVNLGSNNYLGLANDPRVTEAAAAATRAWGAGVTGSRLLNGNLALHEELEGELAAFLGRQSVLVFPTGYTANLGLLAGLAGRGDLVALDAQAHASIIDGALLAHARLRRFAHNDPDALDALLAKSSRPGIVAIEGIYSMQGDSAPVGEFVEVCRRHDAVLIVDEAHSLGVTGPGGRGVAAADGVAGDVDILTLTFSKSLGSCGGAVVADSDVIEGLRLTTRPFLFTASNTPASVAAALAALRILVAEPDLPQRTQANAALLRSLLVDAGLPVQQSDGPILTIPTASDFRTVQAWRMLWNRGVFCNPVVTPAVAAGRGLLRLSVMATHTREDLEAVAEAAVSIRDLVERAVMEEIDEAAEATASVALEEEWS